MFNPRLASNVNAPNPDRSIVQPTSMGGLELKPCLHESSNPGSTHFRSRTEFQSTNGCGLSQSGLQSGLGGFTLEVNPG